MKCNTCAELSSTKVNKPCMRCKGGMQDSVSFICESCSNKTNTCSVCLKKVFVNNYNPNLNPGKSCKSCGNK